MCLPKAEEADRALESDNAAQLGGLGADAYVQEDALDGLCVTPTALSEMSYLDAAGVEVFLTDNGYAGHWPNQEEVLTLLIQELWRTFFGSV